MTTHQNRPATTVDSTDWLVWRYTEAEWAAYADGELARAKQEARAQFWLACALVPLAAGFIFVAVPGNGTTLFLLIFLLALLPIIGGIASTNGSETALTLYQRRLRGPREIRVAARGMNEAGRYTPFVAEARRRLSAEVVPGIPAELRVVLREVRGRYAMRIDIQVPVPHGREAEAAAFVQRFAAEVIGAYRWSSIFFSIPAPLRAPKEPPPDPVAPFADAPTRTLPRLWVGGTPESQRYGWSGGASLAPDSPQEHPTERLPPIR
jgi:hypothetical protein